MEVQPKKVLVIESDEVVLVLISHILTRQSYAVHTARDIDQAEELLRQNEYSTVLMDLRVPGGSIEFLRRLEASNAALLSRIIVVTAALHELPRLEGLAIHGIVRKPFEIYALIETVNVCASRA